jgi:hypothetical protein
VGNTAEREGGDEENEDHERSGRRLVS